MGSDDGDKSHQTSFSFFQRRYWMNRTNVGMSSILFVASSLSLSLFFVFQFVLPPPEILLSEKFTPSDARFPPQCQAVAERFFSCQEEEPATAGAEPRRTVVLTCHRKWCNSWGHCELSAGIGDRMRFLLSQVHQAASAASGGIEGEKKNCVRVLLDYPLQDVAILESAIYKDPAGWLGQLLRYRSYNSKYLKKGSITLDPQQQEQQQSPLVTFQHFTPDDYHVVGYDPCYFHLLFQPTPSMQAELDRHNAAIQGVVVGQKNEQQDHDHPSIGIHFRTGDALAFGIPLNDTRVLQDDLGVAWKKMLACADQLASKLFPEQQHAESFSVSYFLATDNDHVKELARTDHGGRRIYTTTVKPQSTWGAMTGDRDAWMELYLLSQRQGLVFNVLPKHGYHGTAIRRSCFSILAQRIGWIDEGRVQECALDK